MSAMLTITLPAEPSDRFAPTAFASQIGEMIRVNMPDGTTNQGVVLDAVVSPDGTSVELTIEIDASSGGIMETPI